MTLAQHLIIIGSVYCAVIDGPASPTLFSPTLYQNFIIASCFLRKRNFKNMLYMGLLFLLKHTTILFSLSGNYILSWEWRVIADQVQTNYYGGHIVLKSVRCDRAVDFEGS